MLGFGLPIPEQSWKGKMVFKGGTSLSKAYHTIERFSEDINMIVNIY
jgi:predicted nucleotidyltransferase component of viral defense system